MRQSLHRPQAAGRSSGGIRPAPRGEPVRRHPALYPITLAIGPACRERGIAALVWDGAFAQALSVLTGGALLTGCALSLGAPASFIGFLAAMPFFAQIAHIPAMVLIEKLRRRKGICVAATSLARLLLLPLIAVPFIADRGIALALLLGALTAIAPLGAVGGCAWLSWSRDLVPPARLGEVFARRQLLSNLAGIVAGLAGGAIVDGSASALTDDRAHAYAGVFALALLAAIGSTSFLARMPDMPMPPPTAARLRSRFLKPFADRRFRRLMGFLGLWSLAANLALPFFTIYLVQELRGRITTAIALGILSQLTNVATLPFWGRLSDRCSNKAVIGLCAPAFLGCLLGWVLAGQPAMETLALPVLVLLQAVMGAATAGLDLACGNIAMKLAPHEEATLYLGVNALVKSLFGGVAAAAGGMLADRMSGLSCSLVLRWGGVAATGEVGVLRVQSWHLFFIAAVVLGAVALTRLARVEERGAPLKAGGSLRAALGELWPLRLQARRVRRAG